MTTFISEIGHIRVHVHTFSSGGYTVDFDLSDCKKSLSYKHEYYEMKKINFITFESHVFMTREIQIKIKQDFVNIQTIQFLKYYFLDYQLTLHFLCRV